MLPTTAPIVGEKVIVPSEFDTEMTFAEDVLQVGQEITFDVLKTIGDVAVCGWLYASAGTAQDATASKKLRTSFFILHSRS